MRTALVVGSLLALAACTPNPGVNATEGAVGGAAVGCGIGAAVTAPLLAWMVSATPNHMTTSEKLGRAMISVARDGYPRPILESADINAF